jgi:hypothetical protein
MNMEPEPKLSNPSALQNNDAVNYQALITEVRKMRNLSLEDKEDVLDVLATIMGYQNSTESALPVVEEVPVDKQLKPLDQEVSGVVDQNGKKVFKVSGNGHKFEIRGYKAQLPGDSGAVIRYRLTTDGRPEAVPGLGSKSQKLGHTKEKIVEKLRMYLGQGAEKAISDFMSYDATFYGTQG